MASRWGEDVDEELQARKQKIKVGFQFNYMQMGRTIKRLEEETAEWDAKYPKGELLKIWGCAMLMLFILFTLSYNILIVATGLFFFFYGHILWQVFGAWKRFHYSALQYWLLTVLVLAGTFTGAWFLRGWIFD